MKTVNQTILNYFYFSEPNQTKIQTVWFGFPRFDPVRLRGLIRFLSTPNNKSIKLIVTALNQPLFFEYFVKLNLEDNDNKNLHHASLLSCGYSTGFGAAWKEAKVHKGSTVAVFGLGAVGLGVIEGARLLGASKIIGVDINEIKREKGKAFGMTDFINPSNILESEHKPISEMVKELTGGLGVDYCFECAGIETLVTEAIDCTKVGLGTTIMIGAGTEGKVDFRTLSMLSGRTLKGCIFGNLRPKSDLPHILDKWLNKELNLDQLWTEEHQVKLEDINKAFKLMKQPDCVKVLVKF